MLARASSSVALRAWSNNSRNGSESNSSTKLIPNRLADAASGASTREFHKCGWLFLNGSPISIVVNTLEPSEVERLNSALSWLGLGSWREALQEFDKLGPEARQHPDSLEVECLIHEQAGRFDKSSDAARIMIRFAPERAFGWFHLAFALDQLKLTSHAYDTLLQVLEKFPKDWQMHYNMACYACKLQRWSDCWFWLEKAFNIGDARQLTLLAMEDPDLQPYWSRMGMPEFKPKPNV
jgi:tetratricopeptide (TPR) repeat protein